MKRIIDFLIGFLSDKNRKSLFLVIKDISNIGFGKHFLNVSNYFQSMMYKNEAGPLMNYFDGKKMRSIILSDRKRGKHEILENKVLFAEYMSNNNIPIAKYLGKIENGKVYIKDEYKTNIFETSLLNEELNLLLEKYNSIFIKQVDSLGGRNIFKLTKSNMMGNGKGIYTLRDDISYIIEEGVVQHPDLNEINPNSLNTLRVMTLIKGGEVLIPSCFFRVGSGNSYVDNAAAGGMFLDYDINENKIGEYAYMHAGSGGKSFLKDPDTGFKFKDSALPYPDKVKEIVTKAALLFPDMSLIGWDIGYTEEAPVIIEGNSNPSLLMMQITLKGLKNCQVYVDYYHNN